MSIGVVLHLLTGCAAEIRRESVNDFVKISPSSPVDLMVLTRSIDIEPGNIGYGRKISSKSAWRRVGSLSKGEVFRSENSVFYVEGANTHEAYLVVNANYIVGFYLPGEHAYAPLETPVLLNWERK